MTKSCSTSISGDAIRETMQSLMDRFGTRECVFHIHIHGHPGVPTPSGTDQKGIPPMIPGFARSSKDGAHGLIILSQDHGRCLVWLPGSEHAVTASRITVIGYPIDVFEVKNEKRSKRKVFAPIISRR